jgi:streptomycin 6-kinase
MDFPPELAILWNLASVAPLADTRTSRVFRVTRRDGSPAIAKS